MGSANVQINFGMIDDEGWVYVNGQLAGSSHDWSAQPSFDIRKFLHAGDNTIAVAVQNHAGSGGINKGVDVVYQAPPRPIHWKRSAFNGLAQVIVEAGDDAGTLHLTASSDGLPDTSIDISSIRTLMRPSAQ